MSMGEQMKCEWKNILGNEDAPCDQQGTEILPGEWFYYPWPSAGVALCSRHGAAVLEMQCDVWLDDAQYKPQHDRSRNCGARPVVGFVMWHCEGGKHDNPTDEEIEAYEARVGHSYGEGDVDDCAIWGCDGYTLIPACQHCLADPNNNDLDTREAEQRS